MDALAKPILKNHYIPPKPHRSDEALGQRNILSYLRYFQRIKSNPLKVYTEKFYENPIIAGRFIGQDFVHAHHPGLIEKIFVTEAENFGFDRLRRAIFEPFLRNSLITSDNDMAMIIRRVLSPMFKASAISSYGKVILDRTLLNIKSQLNRSEQIDDLGKSMSQLSLDILIACIFSHDTSLNLDEFSSDTIELFTRFTKPHAMDILNVPKWVPRPHQNRRDILIERLQRRLLDLIDYRRQKGPAARHKRDLLDYLLEGVDDDVANFSDDEVIDNLLAFMSAGHQTVYLSLTWTLYLLARQPGWVQKVRHEIDKARLSSLDPCCWPDRLPVLKSVLQESLRLYPAVGIISRQALKSFEFSGFKVPEGANVYLSPWVLHRHKAWWDEPDNFNPNRFSPEAQKTIHKHTYVPFGIGARGCIGQHLAMLEMVIVLAKYLDAFDIDYLNDEEPEPVMSIGIIPSKPIGIRLRPR